MSDDGSAAAASKPRRSKKALAAFVFGLVGLLVWIFGALPALVFAMLPAGDLRWGLLVWILGAVPAILLAVLAQRDIRRYELPHGQTLAHLGLVLGVLQIVAPPLVICMILMHGPLPGHARIAHFHLSGTLSEAPPADPVGAFMGQPLTFHSVLTRLKDAKEDPAVKAAIVTVNDLQLDLSEMEELRAALIDFTSSGKTLFAHCEEAAISMPLFVALGSASRFSVVPTAWLDIKGLYGESLYLKDGLAKVGVAWDVVHIGDYKAAGEMLSRAEPSEAARENMNGFFDGQYQNVVGMLAAARHKPVEDVKALVDMGFFSTDQVLAEGLADAVEYQAGLVAHIKRTYGADMPIDNDYHKEPAPEVTTAHPFRSFWNVARYFARVTRPESGDAIGLIYLNGTIVGGYGSADNACSGDIRAAFKEAMEDDAIKAVVLRVNSPGGSATASEVIYQAAQLLRQRKPLIVSMGSVAASGGYYVACGANTIFADETTLTGSIGVIGSKAVSAALWKKLGANWFPYQRGANADLFASQRPFSDPQRALMTRHMEGIYHVFKEHVEAGRGATLAKPVDDLAGGRIFTGRQALDLGLVDQIGGLQAAIAFAAQSVSLDKYAVRVVPDPKDAIDLLVATVLGESKKPNSDLETKVQTGPGALASLVGDSAEMRGVAALLQGLDRPHADATVELLSRLRLVSQEGTAIMMPQVLVYQ